MKHSIIKTANKFSKRNLKKQVNFETVSAYLQKIGYSIVFYNKDKDNELLIRYNLSEFSKTVRAFTVYRKDFKAVFIDDTASCNDKLYSLLHETAHIILGHIDKKNIMESRLMEMEADAFAYKVLCRGKKVKDFDYEKKYKRHLVVQSICCITVFIISIISLLSK